MATPPPDPPERSRRPSKPCEPQMTNGHCRTQPPASTSPDHATSFSTPDQGTHSTRPPPPPRISPQHTAEYARGRTEYIYRERGADYAFTLATNSYAVPGTGSIYVRHVQSTFAAPIPEGEHVRVQAMRERPRNERDISPLSLTRPMLEDEPPSNPAPRRRSPESRLRVPRSRTSESPTTVLERGRMRSQTDRVSSPEPESEPMVGMDVDQIGHADAAASESQVTSDHLELSRVTPE
ncbi:hypothetical protein A1Q1_06588 [Trichosporon asahii var. asahii CBS 2479]|uniref:Uncharacterized protein n=1 Tax=Trichosporon asahii var. asahii (strain ATCC 90039 / CBS 2479 / JCM 2466 / KCTC 7840 / NBRC 103889/ NCYC 2677 / UAMH 7654) TaxID=1186058 RepID=J5SD45_TRIAS|nr:hypothetical protein A1Q1_06588 [Trichosporon asahii var. asahii CBS 2479]EJT45056.1 hypothetical protein A1Q1_06588 [Trichosporon asahii var. asahii CBS 2479]